MGSLKWQTLPIRYFSDLVSCWEFEKQDETRAERINCSTCVSSHLKKQRKSHAFRQCKPWIKHGFGGSRYDLSIRAVFNLVQFEVYSRSLVLRCCALWLVCKTRAIFLTGDMQKPILSCSRAFSRAWGPLHVFASSSDWFLALFASVVVGHSNYFGSNRIVMFLLQEHEVCIPICQLKLVRTSGTLETQKETGSTGSTLRKVETLWKFIVTWQLTEVRFNFPEMVLKNFNGF